MVRSTQRQHKMTITIKTAKNLSIIVCIAAILYTLTVVTTTTSAHKTELVRREASGSDGGAASLVGPRRDVNLAGGGGVSPKLTAGGVQGGARDLDTAAGGKKYKLVKKKPKHKKIKMDVYEPKMKYKKIKMKVPIKKLKKKKVKGYMVKKKHHYRR